MSRPRAVLNAYEPVFKRTLDSRAADRTRTDDNHVGNVMLYQLSYSRILTGERNPAWLSPGVILNYKNSRFARKGRTPQQDRIVSGSQRLELPRHGYLYLLKKEKGPARKEKGKVEREKGHSIGGCLTSLGPLSPDSFPRSTFRSSLMLLQKRKFLAAIRRGEKTPTLRLWKRRMMKPGLRSYLPGSGCLRSGQVDAVEVDAVEVDAVEVEDLRDADAVPDGFPNAESLATDLRSIGGEMRDAGYRAYQARCRVDAAQVADASDGQPSTD